VEWNQEQEQIEVVAIEDDNMHRTLKLTKLALKAT